MFGHIAVFVTQLMQPIFVQNDLTNLNPTFGVAVTRESFVRPDGDIDLPQVSSPKLIAVIGSLTTSSQKTEKSKTYSSHASLDHRVQLRRNLSGGSWCLPARDVKTPKTAKASSSRTSSSSATTFLQKEWRGCVISSKMIATPCSSWGRHFRWTLLDVILE